MKLRITLCATALMISATAIAHPTDNDKVAQLPAGTKFTAREEVNIKPNTSSFYIQNGKIIMDPADVLDAAPACQFLYVSSSSDRILKVGTAWEYRHLRYNGHPSDDLTGVSLNARTAWVFSFNGTSGVVLVCLSAKYSKNHSLTIGEMREILRGVIEIGPFPPPADF